jgi:thymidylate kinase
MSRTNPLYVAIEGPKGAGKSTLLGSIRPALAARGVLALPLDPTSPGPRLHPLELLHLVPILGECDAIKERLYAYRSNLHADALHKRRGENHDLVLGDRSFITTLATRWRRTVREGEARHYDRCRALEPLIPLPDHVVYLDLPVVALRARVAQRRRTYGLCDETCKALCSAGEAYHAIRCSTLPPLRRVQWHVFNASAPAKVLVEQTLELLLTLHGLPTRPRAV